MLCGAIALWVGPGPLAQRADLAVVRVRTMPLFSYSLLHIAESEGYFAQEGLRVEFVEMDATAAVVPALMRGDIDVLPGVISPGLLNAIARGARIRVVAGQTQLVQRDCSFMGLVVSRALAGSDALTRPDALRGRRLAVNRAFATNYLLERTLAPLGLTPADFQDVDVPDALQGDVLRTGRVDIAVVGQPWLHRVLAAGNGVLWKAFEDASPDFHYSVVAYGPGLLDRNPEVGLRFMTAYLRAIRQIDRGKTDRNMGIVAAVTGLDRETIAGACWPIVREDGAVNGAGLLDFQAWALAKGLVDRPLPLSQMLDDRFVTRASGRLAKEPAR